MTGTNSIETSIRAWHITPSKRTEHNLALIPITASERHENSVISAVIRRCFKEKRPLKDGFDPTFAYSVQELDLPHISVTAAHVQELVQFFPSVEKINLEDTEIDDNAVRCLAQFQKLHKLNITNNSKITD